MLIKQDMEGNLSSKYLNRKTSKIIISGSTYNNQIKKRK